jgi:glycogen operon protein
MREIWPGTPFPLGATWNGDGTNFALFSENAERVELCLFDDAGNEERIELTDRTVHHWHAFLPGVGPGQRYGYRVHGRYQPEDGFRFNPIKLLIDPYAKAIEGPIRFEEANVLPYVPDPSDTADLEPDDEDDAEAIPKSLVIDPHFDWEDDRPPNRPWNQTVIYEAHVRGFTKTHPQVREDLRGTYGGLASEPAIEYLTSLGVTAVELLPVHHIADESFLHPKGLTNYWGYSSIGFLAPHAGYAATGAHGEQIREFKGMVKALHKAGIEVILDVVYNHTAEGNHLGPMLSFKGVDNTSYYRLLPDDPRFYMDFTGTGNSLNVVHPSILRLIMDSLRYWVIECHVDGFRFDLASALARELYEVDRLSAFFDTIHQDPILSQVKLIAEPWDVGPGGYQVGNFPVLWTEWNGMYRDTMRDFWRGQAGVSDFASRLTGSSDLYENDGRSPGASINFITAHDGFTLADLVSYNEKHNDANQEGNRDGTDDNRSWNCGAEGITDDPEILELRSRQERNFLTTLMLSQGVPMLLGGDEINRSQGGNNNAWCQDNEIAWYDWDLDDRARATFEFTRRLIALRQDHPVFRRRHFLVGESSDAVGLPDASWFRPDGRRMTQRDWSRPDGHVVGLFLNGQEFTYRDRQGRPIVDDSFLLLFNAHHEDVTFSLPSRRYGERWTLELSTAEPHRPAGDWSAGARQEVHCRCRSVTVLRRETADHRSPPGSHDDQKSNPEVAPGEAVD